jgi:ABC-type dipeptide/oligopeptide/nickel transport system ATPase subunit
MQLEIKNCNNIDSGIIEIVEGRLNIKYAINGTGKSTVSRAICNAILDRENGTNKLLNLKPFKEIGNDTIQPSVVGVESITSIKVFDESYMNEFVFQPDELLKGSFDVFIRCADYDAGIREIEGLVTRIKSLLSEDQEIEDLINDFGELSGSFGRQTKTGIHGASSLAKAFKQGNKIDNIPEGLEIYKAYIQNANNFQWIKWQLDGSQFLDIADQCPYCVNSIDERKEAITKISEVYKPKEIENLNKVVAVFQRLSTYFSDTTRAVIEEFIKNVDGYTDDQVEYLKEVKQQVDRLQERFLQAKSIGFFSLKDVDQLIEHLNTYSIDITLYTHLQSEKILAKVSTVNESIQQLLQKAGELQGKINIQKRLVDRLVDTNKTAINGFLRNAGYKYEVDLIENEEGKHRLKLIHTDMNNEVKDVKACLSYGERNAFALVLFMFDALNMQPDLVVLDDPISSFDKNKKYAMLDMLFKRGNCFRDKTVLMLSHDFEPIVDMVYHHCDRFQVPFATFLENKNGILEEKQVSKSDIQTFIEVNEVNISNVEKNLISRLVYLRRTYEITNARGMAYQLLSNIFHKRDQPEIFNSDTNGISSRPMTPEEIADGTIEIQQKIGDFNYSHVMELISDYPKMKRLYEQTTNNYEKLYIYRIVFDDRDDAIESDVIKKFINQAFHIENDYIYQLNPAMFQTVPQYVIDECDNFFNAR